MASQQVVTDMPTFNHGHNQVSAAALNCVRFEPNARIIAQYTQTTRLLQQVVAQHTTQTYTQLQLHTHNMHQVYAHIIHVDSTQVHCQTHMHTVLMPSIIHAHCSMNNDQPHIVALHTRS